MDAVGQSGHVRRFGLAGALVVVLALAGSTSTLAADPLAKVSFAVADTPLFEGRSIGTGFGDPGTWSFVRGRMVGSRLELHVEITPVRQTLPITSGPAVLFAGLDLYGDAGGDVAIERFVGPVAHTLIPACNDSDCDYAADISIPIDGLPDAIASLERDGKLIWVSADLTLVRTFGAGEWLQVLAFEGGPGGIASVAAGRLGAMTPTQGVLNWVGLFPAGQATPISPGNGNLPLLDYAHIVESIRVKAGDASPAISAVAAALHVRFVRSCMYWTELTLHDDRGNYLFYADELPAHPLINVSTRMPVDSPWYLTLDAGDGVQNPVVRLGPIQPDGSGSPVNVVATIDCSQHSGTLELTGATTATPIPTLAVAGAGPSPTASPSAGPAADPSTTSASSVAAPVVVILLVGAAVLVAFTLRRRSRPS
jgi:hypothetical protein